VTEEERLWQRYNATRSAANRNALVEHYEPLVEGQRWKLPAWCREHHEDILSELRLRLLLAVEDYDEKHRQGVTFRAYANTCLRYRRLPLLRELAKERARAMAVDPAAIDQWQTRDGPRHHPRRRDLLAELDAATSGLGFTDRTAVYLLFWRGHPLEDVAALLGVKPDTIEDRMRDRLRPLGVADLCAEALATAPKSSVLVVEIERDL
jgi:RNA polymerase sigma factor (sigma-70 family)